MFLKLLLAIFSFLKDSVPLHITFSMKWSHSHLDCTESTIKQLIIEPAIKKMEESCVWAVCINLGNTQEGRELS